MDLVSDMMDGFEAAPFFVKDATLRYVAANEAMAELAGAASPEDMRGRAASNFFSRKFSDWAEGLDRQILADGRAVRDQFVRVTRKQADDVWLFFSRFPVRTAGRTMGIAAIAKNLTAPDRRNEGLIRVAPAVEQIQRGFSHTINVAELASIVGLSISQLDRDFVRLIGCSPLQYQVRLRLDHACELLRSSRGSIADVAHACGYSDQSSFTRGFRAAKGETPTAYRARVSAPLRDLDA